jgi:hypothetical protein
MLIYWVTRVGFSIQRTYPLTDARSRYTYCKFTHFETRHSISDNSHKTNERQIRPQRTQPVGILAQRPHQTPTKQSTWHLTLWLATTQLIRNEARQNKIIIRPFRHLPPLSRHLNISSRSQHLINISQHLNISCEIYFDALSSCEIYFDILTHHV